MFDAKALALPSWIPEKIARLFARNRAEKHAYLWSIVETASRGGIGAGIADYIFMRSKLHATDIEE